MVEFLIPVAWGLVTFDILLVIGILAWSLALAWKK